MDFGLFSHGLFSNGLIMALGKSTGEHMEVSMGYPTMDEGKSHENPMKMDDLGYPYFRKIYWK